MKRFFRLLPVIWTLISLPVLAAAEPGVTVFAAASLRDALEEVTAAYDGKITVSYGGSGQIARQVAQGAPADVAILANAAWMDWLEGNTSEGVRNRLDLLRNHLVLIGPSGALPLPDISEKNLIDRLSGGRLAIGQTQGVPAGIYGRQWLENSGLWSGLSPHLAETENVRTALALVARGEAPMGIVYATDAGAESAVSVLYEIPPVAHDPIIYPAAITGKNTPEALEFMSFIASAQASGIFRSHGFQPLAGAM